MASTAKRRPKAGPTVEEALRDLVKLLPQVIGGFKRAGAATPAPLREMFMSASLKPRHIPALAVVAIDGPLSVSDLASKLDVTLTSASLLVSELSRNGLVDRREDEADRRRTIVSLSAQHREPVEAWLADRFVPLRRTLEALDPPARATFIRALALLESELRAACPRGARC